MIDGIIVHTTNGNPGSSFSGEAQYLRNSNDVSAHYLVGKQGQIAMILPPHLMAFHAGEARPGWQNETTIGIEVHHAIGEAWTDAQRQALTWLVLRLLEQHAIPARRVETHRAVALPPGRKIDPSDWSDQDFYNWRNSLRPGSYAIAGIDRQFDCGKEMFGFYEEYGLIVCGYAQSQEYPGQDLDGEAVRYMVFENIVLKYKPSLPMPWQVRPVQYDEVQRERTRLADA